MICGKSLAIAVTIAIFAFVVISEVEAKEHKKREMKCLGEEIKPSEASKTAMKECGEEFKAKMAESTTAAPSDDEEEETSAEKKQKWWAQMRCFNACKYKKLGLIVDESKPEFDSTKFDADQFPEAAREGLKTDIKACLDAVTDPLTTDDKCKNHETYQTCIMKAMKTNCKWEDKKSE